MITAKEEQADMYVECERIERQAARVYTERFPDRVTHFNTFILIAYKFERVQCTINFKASFSGRKYKCFHSKNNLGVFRETVRKVSSFDRRSAKISFFGQMQMI